MLQNKIAGYRVVGLRFDEKSSSCHYLYMKRHSVREKSLEKPSDRTLFILGIPPYCTEESLKNVFAKYGTVVAVFIHCKPTSCAPPVERSTFLKTVPRILGFKVAYIVFESPLSIDNVMGLKLTTILTLSTEENPVILGLKKWCKEYNERTPDPEIIRKEIDEYMIEFDKSEESRAEKEKSGDADDNGWVTVTRRGRRPGISRKESVGKRILAKEKRKRSQKELLNFYRFQIKESKMNELRKLREKFEQDKKKIEVLKQTRKFKPFK